MPCLKAFFFSAKQDDVCVCVCVCMHMGNTHLLRLSLTYFRVATTANTICSFRCLTSLQYHCINNCLLLQYSVPLHY